MRLCRISECCRFLSHSCKFHKRSGSGNSGPLASTSFLWGQQWPAKSPIASQPWTELLQAQFLSSCRLLKLATFSMLLPLPRHTFTTKAGWRSLKANVVKTTQHTSMKRPGVFEQLQRYNKQHRFQGPQIKRKDRQQHTRATDWYKIKAPLYIQCRCFVFYAHTSAHKQFTQKAANHHSKPDGTEPHIQCKRRIIFTPISRAMT